MGVLTWQSIAASLALAPRGHAIRVLRHRVEHPLDAGFKPTVALPMGQRGAYRKPLHGARALHVYDFDRYYVAMLDDAPLSRVVPVRRDPKPDANGAQVGAALGSLVGLFLGGTPGAATVGAALGALLGSATAPEANQRGLSGGASRPATASRLRSAVRKSNSKPSSVARGRKQQKQQ